LTSKQQEQLTALLEELRTFPIYVMIVRCEEAVGLDPAVEADRDRLDAALSGAMALDRLRLYLKRLRSLNEERTQLGDKIRKLTRYPDPTTRVLALELAGDQEIVVNFFCVSVQHIRSLLKVVAAAVKYEIPPDDLAFLDEFRFLRNHYEHWYSRLPGKADEIGLMTKTLTADTYHVQGELKVDEKDRVIVIEPKKSGPVTHIVDITNDGVARIEKIVQETSAQVKDMVLKRVRMHFIAYPEQDIPPPESIRQGLLIDLGGFEP
jgi:hypothetical protein